ncbi:MAG: MFS transporter [Christensenellaceae bacterium]|jgi:Na+/melibiose symporter-like transporter|nr:MFS transporter [Christensenellaceae bacterium]
MKRLSTREKVIYGVGAFGYGAVNQTFGNFLMFFGTAFLGLPGTLVGLAISVSTVWDAVTDPIVGTMSDNSSGGKLGKRQSFMLVGCIFIAIINVAIWSIPTGWNEPIKFFALLFTLLAVETFNTVYSTPYSALGIDMAKHYDDRTAVQSYKTAFQFLSLLVPSVLIMLGYIWVSVATSMLCVITGLITIFGTQGHKIVGVPLHTKFSLKNTWANFIAVAKLKNVGFLMLAYTISLLCGAVITSLGMHTFTYSFHFSPLQIPIIMGSLIVGIVVGQPLWCKISQRIDKKNTVLAAIVVVLVGMVLFSALLAVRSFVPRVVLLLLVSVTIIITSCGIGCLYTLPISMFADCIYLTDANGDNTATAMGFLTLCTKISNAVIMFVVGVVLDFIGFVGGGVTQTPFVSNALGTVLVVGVVISCVVSWFFYSKYDYTKETFAKN